MCQAYEIPLREMTGETHEIEIHSVRSLRLEAEQVRSYDLFVHGMDADEQTNIAKLLQFLISIVVVKDYDPGNGAARSRQILDWSRLRGSRSR